MAELNSKQQSNQIKVICLFIPRLVLNSKGTRHEKISQNLPTITLKAPITTG